ncbi:MAG: type II and III secretion system protein [Acidobacteria bacterium]|nr:MAG: type II and III secretion system protein [Acidobacteriota bacterium]
MLIRSRNRENGEMKVPTLALKSVAVLLLSSAMVVGSQEQPASSVPKVQPSPEQPATEAPQTGSQPAQTEPQSAAPLRVMVGKSLLLNTRERIKRISVTDAAIADPLVVAPTQILVHGRAPGEVSLLIWDELERSRSFDLRVDVDVSAVAEEEKRVFPDEQIAVTPSRSAIVLSGHVSTEDVAKRAGMIADAYSKNVVNVLTFGPVGAQEILLEVKFAEVDRTAVTQLGINLFAPGLGNTIAQTQTGQFGTITTTHPAPTIVTTPTGTTTTSTPSTVNISDFLNVFVTRTDVNVGAVIKALQQKNLLQILAEPNLIAVNGKEASFLAGGEFPFPVVQPGNGVNAITIQFREFGVRLKFTPVIMLTISGFNVPALSTRRADTEFELQDGQSFVIAGLMDNRVTNIANKIPGLGDIPILGNFFRSKSTQKSNAELMVLCTVRRVSPSAQPPTGPANPQPFLDKNKFDGKKPSGSSK